MPANESFPLAEVGGTNAFLTPEICYQLYRLAFKGDEGAFSQTARAIAVLTLPTFATSEKMGGGAASTE